MTRQAILQAAVAAARAHGVDPVLVAGIIQQESSFDRLAFRAEPHINDASRGLMQLLYGTARWMGYRGEPDGLYDVATNLEYGCSFLRYLLHRYRGDVRRALAAYNAGPGNVDARGWECARAYVESVLRHADALRAEVEAPAVLPASVEAPGKRRRYHAFPLEVPYVSQLEPDGKGYNNCGPACITMGLAYHGLVAGTREDMHRVAEAIRGGPWHLGTYTNFAQMRAAARRYGIPHCQLSRWEAVYDALDQGQPVMILLDNAVLEPRQYPRGPAFDAHHFVVLLGYTDTTFYVADPLSVYTHGPVQYTRASVEAGVARVGGVQALAIDQPPPELPDASGQPAPPGRDEMLIRISDADLKAYFEQLGQPVNMETAIMKRAALAYRRGETRGPALSDEYAAVAPDGRAVIRQDFSAGIAEYDPTIGEVVWVETVLHPEAIRSRS